MLGALGLLGSLAALGKASSSRLPLAKIQKKLPESARAEFKALLDMKKARMEEAKADAEAAMSLFLAQHGMGPKPNYSAERSVVQSFVLGRSEETVDPSSGRRVYSNGRELVVDGTPVAYRESRAFGRFIKVCPGDFGEDKTHRRTANALLSVLGAGLAFRDRDEVVFIGPSGSRAGRLEAPKGCYRVEVSRKLQDATFLAQQEEALARDEIAADRDRLIGSKAVDGLRRRHHRRSRR